MFKRFGRPACFDGRGRLLYPDLEFVATPPTGRRDLTIGGAPLPAGARLDKRLVTPRRLRQLYDARLISVAPGSTLTPTARAPHPQLGPVTTTTIAASSVLEVPGADALAPAPESRPRGVPRRRPTTTA